MAVSKALRASQFNGILGFKKSVYTAFLTNNLINLKSLKPSNFIFTRSISQSVDTNSNNGDGSTKKLSELFSNKVHSRPGIVYSRPGFVYKELSPDMIEFSKYLYEKGYFSPDFCSFPKKKFDAACFRYMYSRNFLKHAAYNFGCNNQEIAKWLSGSDLKKVALFGCPSLSKKVVYSAKTLRAFFRIEENTVCSKCVLKKSCKYVNQDVWNSNTNNLNLPAVMTVISHYALESVHRQLPNEIKTVVTRLLKVVVKLSQTVSARY